MKQHHHITDDTNTINIDDDNNNINITDDNNIITSRFGSGNMDGFNMIGLLLPGVAVTYNGEEIGENNYCFPENGNFCNDCTNRQE